MLHAVQRKKCEHGRRRDRCKECGGASICEHGRLRSDCKECGGASICEHGRQRSKCKDCGGASICEHGRRRSRCKDCGGASFCEHGRLRSDCKECGGASICEHGRRRSRCKDCLTLQQMLSSNRFCACTKFLSPHRMRAGILQCAECDPATVDRVEVILRPMLLPLISHEPSATDDTLFGHGCDVVRRRRPDLLWLGQDRVVMLEIDERGGHSDANYSPQCDLGWVMDMNAALISLYRDNAYNEGNVPHVVVIRFNPDECDTQRVSLDDRVSVVAERVNYYLTVDISRLGCSFLPLLEYHYYHSKCRPHIALAESSKESVRVVDFSCCES
jgi:hypothetical protein